MHHEGQPAGGREICVLGLGYIGLPTAAVLATHGFQVVGVDTNTSVVRVLNSGGTHIEEPGLRTLVHGAFNSGLLRAEKKPSQADVFVIAVPTPLREKQADLSFVEAAARSITGCLNQGNLVVLESTVPPGTTAHVVAPILERSGLKAGTDFQLAHCPERVLPGSIIKEILENDRVIGGMTEACAERAKELYSSFVSGRLFLTDTSTAELVKLVENTFRDVNIALANELARVCEKLGLDVWEVIDLANRHPRVNLLRPGPGVGGHCISVDPWFLVEKASAEARLVRLSREINDSQPELVVSLVGQMLQGIADPKVTLLGLAYKGNVDDTRESPALAVMEQLKVRGYTVSVVDPHVTGTQYELSSLEEAVCDSDVAVLLADHKEFGALSPAELGPHMRTPQLLDTRNYLDATTWRKAGFHVRRLGSNKRKPQ